MTAQCHHWLPLSTSQFKVLILVHNTQLRLARCIFATSFFTPLSVTSLRPLQSSDRLDLFASKRKPTYTVTNSGPL